MTPAARVSAAIAVLDQVLDGAPAEACLIRWARGARYAGSGDRAAVRDHVYQALRCRRSYACLGGATTGRGLMLGALRAAGQDPEAVFTGQGHAPAPLSEAERTSGGAPRTEGDRLDLPDWLVAEFHASLGPGAADAARALTARAPVMLRVNARMNSVSEAIDILQQDGIECARAEIASSALRVIGGARRVAGSAAYRDGRVELQDGSSQAAMEALDLPAGARVLDYCAGGGGKVLALAARSAGHWFAHDADPARMTDLPVRAARAGVAVTRLPPGQAGQRAPYDLVLCDAPCSGSGTWRRTPEAKWRLTRDGLERLRQAQAGILREAAPLVGEGGVLAYATCSVLRCENQDVIDNFLAETDGWEAEFKRVWPISDEGDGFFLAQLRKQ